MVEVVNSLEDLCRLCAGKIDVLMGLNIFASDHRQIFKKICVCLPIQVSVDDSFPKMVCVECACKLDLMFDFRERSILTAHLFSDMMTVNSGNVISADQTIQITNVVGGHDFNSDFMTCKLEAVKYDNQLTTELCPPPPPPPPPLPPQSTPNENILNEESITLHESQDLMSKPKTEQKGRVSRKRVNKVEHKISGEQHPQVKMENETTKVYQQQQQQQQHSQGEDLAGGLTSKDLSTDKLEVESIMGPNEGSQNLNDCTSLEWFFCASCNRTFEDRESYDTHTHDDVKCGNEDDVVDENEEKGEGDVDAEGNDNVISSEVEPNKKKKTKEKKSGKGGGGGVGGGGGGSERKSESKVCLECGKEYQTNYKLQEHMRKHTGEKPFLCSYADCKKAFRSKIGLAQHEANHSGQYEFSCSTCGKGFQCKSYLVVHQRVHSDLKPFVCKQCSRKFKTKQSLLDHMNRHLGVKPFLCDICGRGFITKGLCKSHQKVHSGTDNRQYPCHVCRKLFVSKSYLNTHFRIHTGEKPFMCEVCGKGFLTRVDLRIHSTMHTGEKSFVCEMCGKAFARRDALRCHRRSHTGERPYKCEFCGQSFTQFSPMAIHKRLHTGERPYVCDVCSKTFVSRSTMLAHRKKHHATNNENVDQIQIVSVEVQPNEMNGHSEEQPSDELVVIEESPQLLLALSKRHPSVVNQSPTGNFSTVHKTKSENQESGVPIE